MRKIQTVEQLRAILGEPTAQVKHKIHRQLNGRAREFIQRSPMVLIATADREGQPTVSPKGDVQGFVRVLDDSTLLVPERPGNRLAFSFQNLLANPRVGLIFLVPGTCETLRVSGTAELLDDLELCRSFSSRGKQALLVTRVRVKDCYFHCSKAFLRSALWKPDAWPEPMSISFGEEIAEEGGLGDVTAPELDAGVQRRYETDL